MNTKDALKNETPHFGKQMLAEVPFKCCSKCKKQKQLIDYYKRKDRPCGITSTCKKCQLNYYKTEMAKEKRSVYNKTEKAKEIYSKFAKTEKGKRIREKYRKSEIGIEKRIIDGRKKVEYISDRYLKELLKQRGFSIDQINNNYEIIETIKIIIKTKRLCKTSQN